MLKTRLIGFGHKRRSGKDTAYRAISAAYGHSMYVRRFAFADAVREAAEVHANKYGESERALLQEIGQRERLKDEFHWIDIVARKIADTAPEVAIITDLRYRNEVGWLRSQGGVYVRLDRLNFPRTEATDTHISEHDLDDVTPNWVIAAASAEELKAQVVKLFQPYLDFTLRGRGTIYASQHQ